MKWTHGVCSGVQPVITAPRPTGSVFSLEYWKAWMQYRGAASVGRKLVKQAVAGHRNFNVEEASKVMRFTDQLDPQSGLPITAVISTTTDLTTSMLISLSLLDVAAEWLTMLSGLLCVHLVGAGQRMQYGGRDCCSRCPPVPGQRLDGCNNSGCYQRLLLCWQSCR